MSPALLLAALALAPRALAAPEATGLVGAVVRSREYVVRRAPRKEEEFLGEVLYRREGRSASSDWALYDHDSGVWKARGNVRAEEKLKDGNVLSFQGHYAEHDTRAQSGFLVGRDSEDHVRFTRRSPQDPAPDVLNARKALWDQKAGVVRLVDDLHARGPRGESWADEALYTHAERSLALSGERPVSVAQDSDWKAAVQARRVVSYQEERRVTAEGKARGWIFFPEERLRKAKR